MVLTALAAASLLVLGWAVAYVSSTATQRILARLADRLEQRFGRSGGLRPTGPMGAAPALIGRFVFWAVLAVFAAAALQQLPLPILTEVVSAVSALLPRALLAVSLVLVGFIAANLANHWISDLALRAGSEHARFLGRLAQGVIIVVALIVGTEQIGLQGGVFTALLTVVAASILGSMSLAFALGSRPVVTNLLSSYYAAKALSVGDRVRIGGVEGIISEIGPTAIVIDAAGDRVHLPAKSYCEEACVVVGSGK